MKWMIVLVLMIACVAVISDAAAISQQWGEARRAADAGDVTRWLSGLFVNRRFIIRPSGEKRLIIPPSEDKRFPPSEEKRFRIPPAWHSVEQKYEPTVSS